MFRLLLHRNFALLWWGGLTSLTGNRVLSVALPFYVYQQTESTLATAAMVIATIIPSMLLSSIAGVLVDRWDRRRVMMIANVILALALIPLLTVGITGWIWLVYLVAFLETAVAIFFRLAENALLPQLVVKDQLLAANSLNALNDNCARLIGPALGGVLFAVWGLEFVVLFDILSYLIAALLVFFVDASPEQTRAHFLDVSPGISAWQNFRRDWQSGVSIVRHESVIAILFVIIGLTTLGGTMIDPLFAPFVNQVLQETASAFGWILTVQGIGGILGGLLIGQLSGRIKPTYLFSISSIIVGIILFCMFRTTSMSLVYALSFLAGIPSVGSRVGMQTLLQENIADAYRGRVGGLLSMVGSTLELLSVGFAGVMGEVVGIVPMLSIAAGLTFVVGIIGLALLPRAVSMNRCTTL